MLGAFFDDSGTHKGSPAVALGGVLGTETQWDAFASLWKARLAHPLPEKPALKQFHLAPCRAGDGEFALYKQADRDLLTRYFRKIIVDLGLVTVAAVVDAIAWDELIVRVFPDPPKPIELCFEKCMGLLLSTIRVRKPGEKVTAFFDQGIRDSIEPWAKFYIAQPERYPDIDRFVFAPVSEIAALQAADMIATESYYYGRDWLKDRATAKPNPHFREFMFRDLSAGLVLDRDSIAEMAERMRHGPLTS